MLISNNGRKSLLFLCLESAEKYGSTRQEAEYIIQEMIKTIYKEINNIFEENDLDLSLFNKLNKTALLNDYIFYYGCENLKPKEELTLKTSYKKYKKENYKNKI